MSPEKGPDDQPVLTLEERYEIDHSESPSEALLAALSEFPTVDLEKAGPIYQWVDLEAYDDFVDSVSEQAGLWLSFTLGTYQVFVQPGEIIMVRQVGDSYL